VAGSQTRPCGRLCLVDCADTAALAGSVLYLVPLVLDVAEPGEVWAAAALADHVVLVAAPWSEPALGAVLAESLARVSAPLIAVNRSVEEGGGGWSARADLVLPESRTGARLALAGREPRGELGRAITALADRVGALR